MSWQKLPRSASRRAFDVWGETRLSRHRQRGSAAHATSTIGQGVKEAATQTRGYMGACTQLNR